MKIVRPVKSINGKMTVQSEKEEIGKRKETKKAKR